MVVIANDDGRKIIEAMELEPFLAEYKYLTGIEISVHSATERPDFICQKSGRRFGLELVKVMEDPISRQWNIILGGDGQLNAVDAVMLVQEVVYAKEYKRTSAGWRYPKSTMLVIQLIGCDGEEMSDQLDEQLMDEMAETGFQEIWIADYSPMEPHGTVQLIGVKPKRWRGVHGHRFYGSKPYG